MRSFDVLSGGWTARCPAGGQRGLVTLQAFRRVERLAGANAPPAFVVTYACGDGCGDEHQMLMSSPELDLQPVCEPLPPHFDLMTGRMDVAAEGGAALWARSVQRGRWPLTLACPHHRGGAVPGWPSCLRALEPDGEPARWLMVHFRCPLCERRGAQQMRADRLALRPL